MIQQKNNILYIHAGLHKTGTTAIQLFLYKNHQKLKDSGILYPLVDKNAIVPYQHRHLITLIRNNNHSEFFSFFDKLSNTSEKILISSECFLEEPYFIDWFAKLKNKFSDIKIIFYVRRQDDWVESMYKHFITHHWNKQNPTFQEWIHSFEQTNQYWRFYNLNWYDIIKNWQLAFGKENLIVKIYDKELFYKNNLYHDFMKLFELEDLTNYSNTNITTINSTTLNRNIIELRRILRMSFSKNKAKEIENIFEKTIPIDNQNFSSLIDRKRIMSNAYDSNIKLFKEYFNSEKVLFKEVIESDYNNWERYIGLDKNTESELSKLLTKFY